jgi:L-amino acid N-acyltransferase YncA
MTTIRPATAADLPAMRDLWREQMALRALTDARFRTASTAAAARAWQAVVLANLARADYVALVSEWRGEVSGYALAQVLALALPSVGFITDLALDMHRTQGGVARRLLADVRAVLLARGAAQIVALAARHHAVEQAFWGSLGAAAWLDVLWLNSL